MTQLSINGRTHDIDADADTPLLWVLREWVGLTGTKYGCGIAQCGACTVHLDGVATRSCVTPMSLAAGKQVTTIEGLARDGNLHPVQKAWLEHDVPQCGYCHERHDHGGSGAAAGEAQADRRRHHQHHQEYLPLRHLPAGAGGDPRRGDRVRRRPWITFPRSTAAPSSAVPVHS